MNNKYKFNKKIIIITIIVLTIIPLSIYTYTRTWYLDNIIKKFNFNEAYNIEDKGIQMAIKSGFIQKVEKSQEKDGLEVTVDNIIVDKKRIKVFYTIKNKSNHKYIKSIEYHLYDENKEAIEGGTSPYITYADTNLNKVKRIHDSFDLLFSEELKHLSKIKLDIILNESEYNSQEYDEMREPNKSKDLKESSYKYTFYIPIDKKIFEAKKKVYSVDEVIDIQNQKIYIDNITVYPTITIIDIRYDKDNTMKIFEIKDLKISTNDKEYDLGIDGYISRNKDENRSLYFESPYFENNEKLYVKGTGIKAIEKDKLKVVVDIENNKLIKSSIPGLKLKQIRYEKDASFEEEKSYELIFECDKNISFGFEFKDKDNISYHAYSVGRSQREEYTNTHISIPQNIKYKNPITLTIDNYNNLIKKPFKIEAK